MIGFLPPTSYVLIILLCIPFQGITQANSEALLVSQSIDVDENISTDLRDKLESAFRIYPNRKFLGMTWRLWAYNLIRNETAEKVLLKRTENNLKPGGLRYGIKNVFGEPPAYFEQDEVRLTVGKIKTILTQEGYLNSVVGFEIDKSLKKGWGVTYLIDLHQRWTIDQVIWDTTASGLSVDKMSHETLVISQDPLSFTTLQLERVRLSNAAGKLGFATFNEGFVKFLIDTVQGNTGANVTINIRGMRPEGTEATVPHKSMRIGDVFYDQSEMNRNIRPEVISHLVTLENGAGFNPLEFESSYRRLSELGALRVVELRKDFPFTKDGDYGLVDVTIKLRDSNRHTIALEFDMTRADTRYGPLGKFTWTDKNASGRGDVISWSASASIASTQPFSYGSSLIVPNSGEFGFQCSYRTIGIPPKKLSSLPKSTSPFTELILQASKESRPEYSNTSLNYRHRIEWTENASRNSTITIDVLNLSFVDLDLSEAFDLWLSETEDALIINRFSDYAMLGSRLGWFSNFNNFGGEAVLGLEWSGLLGNSFVPDIRGVSVIQFARADCQLVFKGKVRNRTEWTWASRFRLGSAFVSKQTGVLPYDKGYFGGGSNGVRGWPIRELGPGTFSEVNNGNEILRGVGDTRIEGAAEIRMKWSSFATIAVFSDLGNIWLHETGDNNGTSLQSSTWNSLALSSGLGLRLDFDFFLIRLDAALRLHDPTKLSGERWLFSSKPSGALHLGLGHPF